MIQGTHCTDDNFHCGDDEQASKNVPIPLVYCERPDSEDAYAMILATDKSESICTEHAPDSADEEKMKQTCST